MNELAPLYREFMNDKLVVKIHVNTSGVTYKLNKKLCKLVNTDI